jgi:hypothetical protein
MLKFNKEITELEVLRLKIQIGDIFELTFNSLDESLWITKQKLQRKLLKHLNFFSNLVVRNPVDKDLKMLY